LVQSLVQGGFALYANDVRGHGKSEGIRTDVELYDDYVLDEKAFIEIIASKYPNLPIFMAGYSMGAVIACNFTIKNEQMIKGLIVSGIGTDLKVKFIEKLLLKIIPLIKPNARFPFNFKADQLTTNTEVIASYESDPLVAREPSTYRQTRESLKGGTFVMKNVRQLRIPVLVQCGTNDKVLGSRSPISKEGFEKLLNTSDKTIKVYEGLYHEIYNEPKDKRDMVLNDLVSWLNIRC